MTLEENSNRAAFRGKLGAGVIDDTWPGARKYGPTVETQIQKVMLIIHAMPVLFNAFFHLS